MLLRPFYAGSNTPIASDLVSAGGHTVSNQHFALIDHLGNNTVSTPTLGKFGLSLQQLSAGGVTPFGEVLAKEAALSQSLFSVALGRSSAPFEESRETPDDHFNSKIGGIVRFGSFIVPRGD